MTAADVFQQHGSPAGLPLGPAEHSIRLCRYGHHRWPPQPGSDWTSCHLTQSGSIRRLLEMRNSHPVTCESPSGIELSDVKEEQEFGCMDTKTVKAHLGRVKEATVKVRAGLGGMKVYRVMGKRDQRHSCFREVEGLFQGWVTFIAFGAILSEPGCTLILCPWVQIVNPSFLFRWFWEETAIKCSLTTQSERSRCAERRRVEWPPEPGGARNQELSGPKCQ